MSLPNSLSQPGVAKAINYSVPSSVTSPLRYGNIQPVGVYFTSLG